MDVEEKNKVLNLYPIDYPFETLVGRELSGKLKLNPEFQRKYKWDKEGNERASKFIESCLMRIPLPACYFAEDLKGNHDVIDGVQRITTIKNFFADGFALEGLTIFKELEGKKFSELDDLKGELESTTIRCIVLRKENPKELIQEIFARLNQGAVQLSAQEIRHAIYPGTLDKLLSDLGAIDFVQTFGRGNALNDSREQDEMVLRFFAMQSDLEKYEDRLFKLLDQYMEANHNMSNEDISKKREQFETTLQKCLLVFDGNPFVDTTRTQPRQSLVLYDLIMWSFKDLDVQLLLDNKDLIQQLFKDLCNDPAYKILLSGGQQKKYSILKRRALWTDRLKQIHE